MDFRGKTLGPPDSAAHLIVEPGLNIAAVNKVFSPLLSGQAIAFEEVLNWIKLAFIGYYMWDYMATKATPPIRTTMMKKDKLFTPDLTHLWYHFHGDYPLKFLIPDLYYLPTLA